MTSAVTNAMTNAAIPRHILFKSDPMQPVILGRVLQRPAQQPPEAEARQVSGLRFAI